MSEDQDQPPAEENQPMQEEPQWRWSLGLDGSWKNRWVLKTGPGQGVDQSTGELVVIID